MDVCDNTGPYTHLLFLETQCKLDICHSFASVCSQFALCMPTFKLTLLSHIPQPAMYINSNRPLIRYVYGWCSCGRYQALHPLKPRSTTSTCPQLAQGQDPGTHPWTPQPWVHTHSGMSATATTETTRITSACAGMMEGHQGWPMAVQVLLAACLHLGGNQCLPCSSSLVPCLLVWVPAGRPFRVAHCPQGCQHSPSNSVHQHDGWLSCFARQPVANILFGVVHASV